LTQRETPTMLDVASVDYYAELKPKV